MYSGSVPSTAVSQLPGTEGWVWGWLLDTEAFTEALEKERSIWKFWKTPDGFQERRQFGNAGNRGIWGTEAEAVVVLRRAERGFAQG